MVPVPVPVAVSVVVSVPVSSRWPLVPLSPMLAAGRSFTMVALLAVAAWPLNTLRLPPTTTHRLHPVSVPLSAALAVSVAVPIALALGPVSVGAAGCCCV